MGFIKNNKGFIFLFIAILLTFVFFSKLLQSLALETVLLLMEIILFLIVMDIKLGFLMVHHLQKMGFLLLIILIFLMLP